MKNTQLSQYNFLLRLKKHDFEAALCCLGDQFSKILTCIQKDTDKLNWFIFDVYGSSNEPIHLLFQQKDNQPYCFVESTDKLIKKVTQVKQFHSGVFIGIPRTVKVMWDENLLPETEEGEGLQHPLAEIEIRPFDCSYFEIYGTDMALKEKIIDCFIKKSG